MSDESETRYTREAAEMAKAVRNFPRNTCPASRHVELMADALAEGKKYPMLEEDPAHCAGSLYSVLHSLWKARTELEELKKQR